MSRHDIENAPGPTRLQHGNRYVNKSIKHLELNAIAAVMVYG